VNAFPSLHVSLTILAVLFVFARSWKWGVRLLPLGVLIILSTLFIKQHAVVDVIGGLLLAWVVFRLRMRLGRK
jgi:membrane-associated phospholipid phosphatase